MNERSAWIGAGIALGAGLMAVLDPNRGRRRRALIRDKAARAAHTLGDAAGTTWRDLSHRAAGAASEARRVARGEQASDEVLAERVRSRIGRLVSHPGSIEVAAKDGEVALSGPVLRRELDGLLRGVRCVRGLTRLEDRLEVHEEPGSVPGLQGEGFAREPRFELFQENWSPTARLLAGLAGATLAGLGARRRGALGGGLFVIGTGVVLRAATNRPMKRLLGLGSSRRGIDIAKTLTIDAPVAEVYDLWSRWENFPRIFSHVHHVSDSGGGRTRWTVAGPAGASLSFAAVVTAFIPNQLLAWKSAPGEPIRHAGVVRFDPDAAGGTRIGIQMTYNPPAGALGHAVAALFGVDPEHALHEDMVRLKSLLEQGRTEAHGEEVTREEVTVEAAAGEEAKGEEGMGEELKGEGAEEPEARPAKKRSGGRRSRGPQAPGQGGGEEVRLKEE